MDRVAFVMDLQGGIIGIGVQGIDGMRHGRRDRRRALPADCGTLPIHKE
jgi:hypothetical protein